MVEVTLAAVDTDEERIQRMLDEKRELFEESVDDLRDQGMPRTLTEDYVFDLFGLNGPRCRDGPAECAAPPPRASS